MPTYHQTAFDHIHYPPRVSTVAQTWLNQLEDHHQVKLPASVREWYSIVGSTDLLRQHSNRDEPVHLHMLDGELSRKISLTVNGQQGHLVGVLWENQAVYKWTVFIPADASIDDPSVYVGCVRLKPNELEWKLFSHTFSDFIYAFFWDYAEYQYNAAVTADFTAIDYDRLRDTFHKLPLQTFSFPREITCRLYRNDQRVVLWRNETEADGYFSASTPDSMRNLVQTICQIDSIRQYIVGNEPASNRLISEICG